MITGIMIFAFTALCSVARMVIIKGQKASFKWRPYKGDIKELDATRIFGRTAILRNR